MKANKIQQSPPPPVCTPTSRTSRNRRVVDMEFWRPGAHGQQAFSSDPGLAFQTEGPAELSHDASWIQKYNLSVTPTFKYKTSSLKTGTRHYTKYWE